ncbi:MAG: PH domain-containing protein, partial [Actinobacteria bacterium]|nr:PH domain-containing protein [Actinomycetota bacterium]
YLCFDWLRKRFTRYVITDLRVLRITGVLHRRMEFIPWGKITDVSRSETLMQWVAGSATIRIESANERSAFRAMTDVSEPDRFYRVLVRMVDLKQGRVEGHERVRVRRSR